MARIHRVRCSIGLALVFLLATASTVFAADKTADGFPAKPVVNIVSWSAGGTTDIGQRLVGSILPKYLGQTMVVENQPGGAAVPGTTAIAKSKPDGYTIGVNWGASWTLRPYLIKVPYKKEDFTFIIGMLTQRNLLCVRNDSPFKTLDDLVEFARANPGKLNWGGGVAASYQHLTGAAFLEAAKLKAEMIPYDGSRPSVVALLGGNVDFAVVEPGNMIVEERAGQLRVLCVFEKERLAQFPDAPTAIEKGFNVNYPNTQCIVGPAGMPADRVKILHDALKKTFEDPEFLKLAANAALEIEYKSGEEVSAEIDQIIRELDPIIGNIFPNALKRK